MPATQVHIIDPCAGGMILVQCEDGSRLLFGSSVMRGVHDEIVQHLFEVLEDGQIDYFVHAGVEPDGKLDLAELADYFPVKTCAELVGEGIAYPAPYLAFREGREIETLDPDDILEFGRTSVRVLGAPVGHPMAGGTWRPLALHVSHEREDGEGRTALLALGATGGLDWAGMFGTDAEELKADCLVVDGRRPLDIVITAGEKPEVSIDCLRRIAPSTIVLGADAGKQRELRNAARALYECFTRENAGGAGVIEMRGDAWISLVLDGETVKVESEPRPLGKAA
jgi:hypothetical protein